MLNVTTRSSHAASLHDRNAPTATIAHRSKIPADPHDESVYRLIPEIIRVPEKRAMYRSKFSDQAAKECKAGVQSMASMGPAKVEKERPSRFLKKHSAEKKVPIPVPAKKKDAVVGPTRPPVPKHNELNNIPPPTKKDFIKTNALENIHSVPRKPKSAGPAYVDKKDYGRTPDYVAQRQHEAAEEQARWEAEQELALKSSSDDPNDPHGGGGDSSEGLVLLPEEERVAVLDGLKKNWERLNTDYQKLSLTVDTVPKIARKVNMESQLKRLEEDIQKFSVPSVYVHFYG